MQTEAELLNLGATGALELEVMGEENLFEEEDTIRYSRFPTGSITYPLRFMITEL